jgi:hypothetical protein
VPGGAPGKEIEEAFMLVLILCIVIFGAGTALGAIFGARAKAAATAEERRLRLAAQSAEQEARAKCETLIAKLEAQPAEAERTL